MNAEEALVLLDTVLQGQKLRDVQEQVFRYAWQGWTYPAIANQLGYDTGHIRDVGSQLWQQITQVTGEKVSKNNVQSVLRRQAFRKQSLTGSSASPTSTIQERINEPEALISTVHPKVEGLTVISKQYWGEKIDISAFHGRHEELLTLKQWTMHDRCRVVILLGMEGVGKTWLSIKLAQQLQNQFEYVIWQSLRNAPLIEDMLADLIKLLSNQQGIHLPQAFDLKIVQLIDYLRQHRCLIVLDNFESILNSENRAGEYREKYEGYSQFLRYIADAEHKGCFILTSREKPKGLAIEEDNSSPVRTLQVMGLVEETSQEIFRDKGFCGIEADCSFLNKQYQGNPLALKIAAIMFQELFGCKLAQFLEQGAAVFGDIATPSTSTQATAKAQHRAELSGEVSEIDRLVPLIREKVYDSIRTRCGYMRVLDMSQPIGLEAIYTTVNIAETIRRRQRRTLTDLLQQHKFTHLDQIQESRISGLAAVEKYSKLMIFGKPGAGKTTFLKWLAVQCNSGHLWENLIPVFIPAKAFAESKDQPELLNYIHKQWADCGVLPMQIDTLLQQGRALILLDGLDEVRETDHDRVLQEIREFSTQLHKCRFVITCRIAAQEYTFEQFTEVEITDFDDQQITDFVTQWFESRHDSAKTAQFLNQLRNYQRIRDLATNPLLLTLLCLVFHESADFPANRAELYQEGLEILLKTWDVKRNIQRDGLYRKLSLQCKEALLSEIAFITFERGDYFFKKQAIEQYITNFLSTLPLPNEKLEPLEIDGEAILKSIEVQHGLLVERARGVYSFSHLTFHEYFTAKRIADKSASQLEKALQTLASHVTHREWREVFLLTVSLLKSADALLLMMKAQIDEITAMDEKLQKFLTWLDEKNKSVTSTFSPATVRSHFAYLVTGRPLARAITRNIADDLGSKLARANAFDTSSDITSARTKLIISSDFSGLIANSNNVFATVEMAMDIATVVSDNISNPDIVSGANAISTTIRRAIDKAISLASDPKLEHSLHTIKNQLPDPDEDLVAFTQWWKDYGHAWVQQLRGAQIRSLNLIYDWQFSELQITLLDQYYEANLLLLNCLNSDCYVSQVIRDEIEATLLLSTKDVEQFKKT